MHQPHILEDSLKELLSWLSKGLISIQISHDYSLSEVSNMFPVETMTTFIRLFPGIIYFTSFYGFTILNESQLSSLCLASIFACLPIMRSLFTKELCDLCLLGVNYFNVLPSVIMSHLGFICDLFQC